MADQSLGQPMLNLNNASSLPRLDDGDNYTDWLRQLDITVHDIPYIDSILQQGYAEWRKLVSDMPELGEAGFFLADSRGDLLLADSPASGKPLDPSWPPPMEAAIAQSLREHEACAIETADGVYVAVPLLTRSRGEVFAALGCFLRESGAAAAVLFAKTTAQLLRTCFYQCFEGLFVSDLLRVQQQTKREEQRRSKLFQVVQKLHDKIDVDSVLTEVFERVSGMYPAAKLELLMSQENLSRDPRVKSLQLHGQGDELLVRAFMEGRMQVRDAVISEESGERQLEIAVPLSGKQGVYGVFHLQIRREEIDDVDLQLIGMLADTAGTAFENAKLYEQSNLLINELRLINELTKRLNQSLRLKEVFQFATEELLSIFKAEYCCISQLSKERETFEIMSSNVPGLSKELFPKNYGFSGLVYSTQEPIILSDFQAYGKVSSRFMEETGSRSLITAPLIVRGEVNGVIMLAHRDTRFFSYDNYKLLQVLSSHIGLAIANASQHAEVRRMANRDMLTGLYARHYVDDAIQEFQKKDTNGSLIIVDIDQFKQVNDTYGHQTGDKILKQVCAIVKSSIRKTDIAARWGGEELAVYLPGASADNSYQIAETIRLRVAMDTDPPVTVSCGIAEWIRGDDKLSVESLFYQADMALYKAKNNGRNQTQIGSRDDAPAP
ncbi:MAG: diguanylate cyclase [Paenibacillus sp.]|uniref:diguanylate cyclase n=1 Tax=Paenibacillus sp. TaxID=58172 RepID=UPI0029009FE0|nr:diguanylate cyclase [Paenibacillus sp.]MDU2240626.1 diguanylate cyclase [Paenibacillus sp.]